jgi:hypothetical protein
MHPADDDLPPIDTQSGYRARHPGHTERIRPELYRGLGPQDDEWPTAPPQPTQPVHPVVACAGESTLTRAARLVGIFRDVLVMVLVAALLVVGAQTLRGLRDPADGRVAPTPTGGASTFAPGEAGGAGFCVETPGG